MDVQEFQEKLNTALLYKKEGRLIDALNLYKELYVQLIREAADYAKCIEHRVIYEENPRELSPKFLQHAGEYLRSDNLASLISNNLCVILAETGHREAARKYFKKSIKYIPGGTDYPDYEMWMKD